MKIERKELLEELQVVVKDEFVAEVQSKENGFVLTFTNGQKFFIEAKEL